jgi:hypothetical protein
VSRCNDVNGVSCKAADFSISECPKGRQSLVNWLWTAYRPDHFRLVRDANCSVA